MMKNLKNKIAKINPVWYLLFLLGTFPVWYQALYMMVLELWCIAYGIVY